LDETELDGCAGSNDFCDSSVNSNHGNEDQGVVISTGVAPVNFTNARSLELDADADFSPTGDYVEMGDVLDMGTSDWSVSAWIRGTDTAGHILSKAWSNPYYALVMSGSNARAMYHNGTATNHATGTTNIADGMFHHLVAVWDRDGNLYIYVDGLEDGSVDISADSAIDISNSNNLSIGANCDSGCASRDNFYGGLIDDVRIYNRALTLSEIKALAGGHPMDATGTITLQDTLDVNGSMILGDGIFAAAGAQTITVAGDWTNESATFTYATSTVSFDDDTKNNIITGSTTFYNLDISTATGKTVTFSSGDTTTIAASGSLTLTGASGQMLTLAPGTAATDWLLTDNGSSQSVSYVDVTYSDALLGGGTAIDATDGTSNERAFVKLTGATPVDITTP